VGLFSSKTRITVGTAVTRVLEDKMLPDSIKSGLTAAIFGRGDIATNAMDELAQGIGIKADRMYRYGESGYLYGLPSGQTTRATQGKPEVTAILTALEGQAVDLEYCHYGAPNLLHIGWTKLTQNHGYNPTNNQLGSLTTSIGHSVWLNNMTVVVGSGYHAQMEVAALDQWGAPATAGYTPERPAVAIWTVSRAPTQVLEEDAITPAYLKVDYIWAPGGLNWAYSYGTFNISTTEYDDNDDYFHVKYTVGTATKYWMYKRGTGTYPTLDNLFTQATSVNGTYFPFAWFRFNQAADSVTPGNAHYESSKKLLKYLNMDYAKVSTALNQNPGIADVHQAMMVMAVPALATHEVERRYLFDYFSILYDASPVKLRTPVEATLANLQEEAGLLNSAVLIRDARFQMALANGGIIKKRFAGTVASVGKHTSGFINGVIRYSYMAYGEDQLEEREVATPVPYHYYRKQINKFFYDEIIVMDLRMVYFVYGGYNTTADEGDRTLLIPLDRSITETYSTPVRELLYSRSLHFVFNSVQIQKIKWYQQTFFKVLIIVAAIAISIWTMNPETGAHFYALVFGTAAEAGVAAIALLATFAPGLLLNFALEILARAIGAEAALILAVVAAVTATGLMINAGSIKGVPFAAELLQISSGLAKGGGAALEAAYKGIQTEFQTFKAFAEQANEGLEQGKKLLENDNYLSPFVIFGESPDDYYNRTVHSGNIGVSSLSAVSSYVDIALTLPKIDDTLRGDYV